MRDLTDAALVAQAQAELPYRTGAFETLMRRHGGRIRQVARRFAGTSADAEDLAQEVMLKVFFELPRFRGESAFTTWLWRITANLCIDHQRRRAARPAATASADESEEAETVDPRDPIAATLARVDVERLLRHLGPEDRMLVLLRSLLELEFSEIATAMGLGRSATKMRFARAMQKLQAAADASAIAAAVPAESGG